MDAAVRFRLLGPLEVTVDGQALPLPAGQTPQVLSLLLLRAGQVVGVGTFHDVLWDGDGPDTFRKIVQIRMSQLRRLFADTPVDLDGSRSGYRLVVPPGSVDLHEFRALVAEAAGQAPAVAEPLLRRALGLWRGPALAELAGTTSGMRLATALDEERLAAVEAHADAALAAGRHVDLAGTLAPVVAEHPLRERLRARLMAALSRAGRQSDALAVYDDGRRLLADELGLDPGAELREAHAAVLRGDTGAPARDVERVPAQLPADLYGFAGREDELARLDGILAETGRQITALSGTAGVGKTVLAVHWAHRVAPRFPDGQLYVNLRGFGPAGAVLSPGEAVRGFLDALGVARVPGDVDAQAALYRSLLAGRRMLVVLDNARDAEQVRPLLPGSPGSLVVVTSRDQLTGLVVTDGAHPVVVDRPTVAAAGELLATRLGRDRVAAEPEATGEIISRCARLPLALAVVAARAVARPAFPLSALAGELRAAQRSLDPLGGGDPAADVRTVLSWSYRALSDDAARLFRLLGLHLGADIAAGAAARLADADDVRARLAELTSANLLTEHRPGRYTSHDLLRDYATELAGEHDDEASRKAALTRLLDYYLFSAHAADRMLRPQSRLSFTPRRDGVTITPETFGPVEDALTWFAAEYDVLVACTQRAGAAGFDPHVWQLARTMIDYGDRVGRWADQVAVQRAAFAAAVRLGDRTAQAHACRGLGRAYSWLGRHEESRVELGRAATVFAELDDWFAQANTTMSIAYSLVRDERWPDALGYAETSLRLYRSHDHVAGAARALGTIGWILAKSGDHAGALAGCEEALVLMAQTNDTLAIASVLHSIAYIHQQTGDVAEALAAYERALELFREAGDRYNTGESLHRIGELHAPADPDAARAVWREALAILTDLDHADAAEVRVKLAGLDKSMAQPAPTI
jgi:DNA-binding SARP family transcriptional activator/tetratricopeptide (TPR) repeat protein